VLPDIRFRVDDAHIGLISSSIHQYSILQLKEGVASVVLLISIPPSFINMLTGEGWQVVALLAKGTE